MLFLVSISSKKTYYVPVEEKNTDERVKKWKQNKKEIAMTMTFE